MDTTATAKYRARAAIIKAMAHPTRLYLMDVLAKRERCVCELTAMVGDDISTVSKHLSVLKNAGIVTDTRKGNQVFYALLVPCIMKFFPCVESVLRANVKRQHEVVR